MIGTGETITFWVVAPVIVLGALGLVGARKAVHGAMSLAVVMVGLAVLYLAQEAPFLGIAQIVVYTGAIMMVFLFVIMLVGVDSSDSRVETIRGQRVAGVLVVLAIAALLISVVTRLTLGDPVGMAAASPEGNVAALADAFFGRYVVVFEVLAALLITAAVGAMALAHTETVHRRRTQRELSEARFRGGDPGTAAGLPVPGVYARHNAVDTPALLPDGSPSALSVSRIFADRDGPRPTDRLASDVAELEEQVDRVGGGPEGGTFDAAADPDAGRVESTDHPAPAAPDVSTSTDDVAGTSHDAADDTADPDDTNGSDGGRP